MSAAERPAAGVEFAPCEADLVQIAALRGREAELTRRAAAAGLALPPMGGASIGADRIVLCVRPARWWVLGAPGTLGFAELCAGLAAEVELSSGYRVLYASGPALTEALARGCRLDLDPTRIGAGRAAATQFAQVPVVIAALRGGLLLITPSTTAQHFAEWLESVARPFGCRRHVARALGTALGERDQ